ncbi:SUMO-activating enzyme subunit 1A [Cardamine amara subsp. amara]|uniref:Ubiquitin-like 1-activating enzyme E1A n=1 Tax=Cardamine amara subsp. amara TaxID=228776 RepID=A0ABD1A379_CARAN
MDGEELTEQETALYDRQIRVWGANAQRRLTKAHILVSGIKGTVAEFCKNIVLAGVGSVTLMDDRLVKEEALNANFLIPPDESAYSGKTVAETCCDSLKDFNPMVLVSAEKGDLSTFGTDFFEKFDVVVIGYGSRATKKSVNEKCRELSKRVAFYTVDCRDSCGEIFVDLQNYKYTKKKLEETVECELNFPSFQEAISVPWKLIPRRTAKLYFAMRVIEVFEENEGRKHGECSLLDLATVLEIKKKLCEANSVSESHIPNSLLERLITGNIEFPPACAIVGGILAQEVIKAVSGKGDPLKNFFFFDGQDGKGVIEDISNSLAS